MGNTIIVLMLAFLIIGLVIVILLLLKKSGQGGDEQRMGALMERLSLLTEQNREMRQVMDSKLAETHRANQEQFSNTTRIIQGISGQSAKLISDVTEKLTKLDETNKQIVNFSGQLQNLQDILKNPKQRGILGEYFLEETLKNVLPPGS